MLAELSKYPMAFDGKAFIGPNIAYVVYVWTEDGNPCYVGVTSMGIHTRCMEHLKKDTHVRLFQNKLRARPESFKCYVIDMFYKHSDAKESFQHLLDLETYYIDKLGTFHMGNVSGYNLTIGGEGHAGGKHSEETRKKMSASQKTRKPISEETRKKLSLAKRNMSNETRLKMSASTKNRPPVSEETRRKQSIAHSNMSNETRRKMSISAKNRCSTKQVDSQD